MYLPLLTGWIIQVKPGGPAIPLNFVFKFRLTQKPKKQTKFEY